MWSRLSNCLQSLPLIKLQTRSSSVQAHDTVQICGSWPRSWVRLSHSEQGLAQQLLRHTYLQHCFFILRPPNLGLSRQLVQTPQSSGTWQPEHCPQRLERRPFFTGGSCWALFLVTGLMGLMGGATGSASSEPAIDDLSTKRTFLM